MDNSHVALVSVLLKASGFENYRCDRSMPLGINVRPRHLALPSILPARRVVVADDPSFHLGSTTLILQLASLTKILKCANDTDIVTLKAADDADSLGLMFEASRA